jgi:hypothetical protein
MTGTQLFNNATYRLWQHDRSTDEVDGANTSAVRSYFTSAVRSYFTTPILTAANFQQPMDKSVKFDVIETDFLQSGNMTVTALTRANARDEWVERETVPFMEPPPTNSQDEQVKFKKLTARQTQFRFESNEAGGDYQSGKHIAYIEVDQARRT